MERSNNVNWIDFHAIIYIAFTMIIFHWLDFLIQFEYMLQITGNYIIILVPEK